MIEYRTGMTDTGEIRAYAARTLERLEVEGWILTRHEYVGYTADSTPVKMKELVIELKQEEDLLALKLQYPTFKDAIAETIEQDPRIVKRPGWL